MADRWIDGRGPYPDDYVPWEPAMSRVRTGWLLEPEPPMRLLDHLDEPPVEYKWAA